MVLSDSSIPTSGGGTQNLEGPPCERVLGGWFRVQLVRVDPRTPAAIAYSAFAVVPFVANIAARSAASARASRR
jgi:hypothetical protein